MFESLTNRLNAAFSKITSRGVLSEKDIDDAMREIRVALLEADVSLSVVKDFIAQVKAEALGEKVVKSVQPGQMVVKIVHDELVKLLGGDDTALNFNAPAPVCLMLVGLQGSGKTTTAAKLAQKLKKSKRILLASLDVYRPAAQEQLAQLGKQIGVDVLPVIAGQKPLDITKRALKEAKTGVYDLLILDTAGRLQIDEALMNEVADVKKLAQPTETLLVADALIGQEACNVAKEFNEKVGITGLVLTRIDGTSRAGAALSMKMVSGAAIKFLGTGEKLDEIEEFHADRIAGRILGQGDVVSLVEKAIENVDHAEAEKMARKMMKGKFEIIWRDATYYENIPLGHSKGTAIEFITSYLGADMKDTIAFGDSFNDMPMFETAHTSVVMGNGEKELDEYVTFRTTDEQEDGILNAMKRLELI
jgi:signal recognition particle subunit SRP54